MSKFVRTLHRWVSMLFVLSVIVTTIALAQKPPLIWVSYVPLAPLAVLALTGVYLFVLPYVRRSGEGGG